MIRKSVQPALAAALLALLPALASAADCPGNPDALGTARVLTVDPATTPAVGRKHFPVTLPLQPNEIVLTFDDGPWPGTTDAVLAALRHECVKATFFMLGRNATAHPALAKKVLTDGHTVAYHTYSHPLLNRMSVGRAEAEIDRGFAAIDQAVYGSGSSTPKITPKTPFFRFPGFASSPALIELLAKRHITVFGADLWASDWNRMRPDHERTLVLERLAKTHGGILLFHDTQAQTAKMLPALLRDLKRQGYRIVHVVAR
ncbi:polysaccharide deacetylase family protein [Rhodoplanes sp. Z2-YC6860]|uniref:polysaccharide deacetylase family protein n=1 Tax=Rhodoplanes sp. Z2-YC6860 TaxID=674703 RepID=UPI000A00C51F